jgi:hypothetical protein
MVLAESDLADLGIDTAIGAVKDVWKISTLEAIAERIIPAAAKF